MEASPPNYSNKLVFNMCENTPQAAKETMPQYVFTMMLQEARLLGWQVGRYHMPSRTRPTMA